MDAISPSHYKGKTLECIDILKSVFNYEAYCGFVIGNIFKYLYRYKDKNGVEDLRKVEWYLKELMEHKVDEVKSISLEFDPTKDDFVRHWTLCSIRITEVEIVPGSSMYRDYPDINAISDGEDDDEIRRHILGISYNCLYYYKLVIASLRVAPQDDINEREFPIICKVIAKKFLIPALESLEKLIKRLEEHLF